MEACITGIDYALPSRCVTNAELEQLHPQWQIPQFAARTGVNMRYWCAANETALDLALSACRRLFARCAIDPLYIDAIIFCTQSPDYIMPPNSCIMQNRLGLRTAIAAFDFTHACSGFIYGLYCAKALVRSGAAKNVLLVTAETYSKWINPDDRGPATLFGDGAAAVLVAAGPVGIGSIVMATDGSGERAFCIPAGGARLPTDMASQAVATDKNGNSRLPTNIHMDGVAILDFVKDKVPRLIRDLLEQAGLKIDDLDLVVFHQASQMALDVLNRIMHIPVEKRFSNLALVGNTVSASIPIALRDAEKQGVLKPGMKVMVVGFGAGLSWGGAILNWQ